MNSVVWFGIFLLLLQGLGFGFGFVVPGLDSKASYILSKYSLTNLDPRPEQCFQNLCMYIQYFCVKLCKGGTESGRLCSSRLLMSHVLEG